MLLRRVCGCSAQLITSAANSAKLLSQDRDPVAGLPLLLVLRPTTSSSASSAPAASDIPEGVAPSRSPSSVDSGPRPGYNNAAFRSVGAQAQYGSSAEAKDTAFNGRVIQLNGQHATVLSVAGSSSKDYNLLLARRNVADVGYYEPGVTRSASGVALDEPHESFVMYLWRKLQRAVQTTFLPAGYPATVGDNYLRFISWQAFNNVAATANSVLASTFLLYAVGLGAGAIPTAGALNWVLKDGIGQLGTLVFGKTIAHNFDVHSKTWFFLSAVMLKAATCLELLTVLMPNYFLVIGSLANTLKGLSWMASGSTRSVFHLSFARDNNIADITAKGVSQYIFASLLGTAGGAYMCASVVGQSTNMALLCFTVLGATTLLTAYMTVHVIPLATLNSTRLQLLTDAFLGSISPTRAHEHGGILQDLASGFDSDLPGATMGSGYGLRVPADRCYVGGARHMVYDDAYDDSIPPKIPTPVELAQFDPPMPNMSASAYRLTPPIHVGSQLEVIVAGNADLLVMLLTTFKYSHYLLLPKHDCLHVVLHEKADQRDIIQAYLQACILRRRMRHGPELPGEEQPAQLRLALYESLATAERLTSVFMTSLESHSWTLSRVVVEAERRRARW